MPGRRVVAGIDVGNSTTEVVLVDPDTRGAVAWDRAPTRGAKGSYVSLDAAAHVLHRLLQRTGHDVERVGVASLRPVRTEAVAVPDEPVSTGRLLVWSAGTDTMGSPGFGVGVPCRLAAVPPRGTDVVALVPAGFGFRGAAQVVNRWLADGVAVVAVVCQDDEAVLVSNRIATGIAVVDGVPVPDLGREAVETVAVEVAAQGHPLTRLTDSMALVSSLRLTEAERTDAVAAAGLLVDSRGGVVATAPVARGPAPTTAEMGSWVGWHDGTRSSLAEAHARLAQGPPGLAATFCLGGDTHDAEQVADLVTVRLADVGSAAMSRRGSVAEHVFVMSSLRRSGAVDDPAGALAQLTGLDVVTTSQEAAAARDGALTTPGAPPTAAVLDLGGGTIDLVVGADSVVGAGAGDLLTVSVAELLGIPRGAAEWAKRGPAVRIDSPHVVVAEDGSRSFASPMPPKDSLGAVVVNGPAGWLVVSQQLSGSEWRALRLAVKQDVLGGGIRRLLASGLPLPSALVVVGGPAGDDEAVRTLSDVLGPDISVGRGAVAGVLGHRYAVAYGLALTVLDG
jgi:hypothetical protein